MFAPATVRTRKIENGISGYFARDSMSDERDQQHGRDHEPRRSSSSELQPWSGACEIA